MKIILCGALPIIIPNGKLIFNEKNVLNHFSCNKNTTGMQRLCSLLDIFGTSATAQIKFSSFVLLWTLPWLFIVFVNNLPSWTKSIRGKIYMFSAIFNIYRNETIVFFLHVCHACYNHHHIPETTTFRFSKYAIPALPVRKVL